jgi:hypothetical protein
MDTGLGTTAQGETVPLTVEDRRTHVAVFGKTDQGKSVLLENIMFDNLAAGRGFAPIDPHGTSARRIADSIPPHGRFAAPRHVRRNAQSRSTEHSRAALTLAFLQNGAPELTTPDPSAFLISIEAT